VHHTDQKEVVEGPSLKEAGEVAVAVVEVRPRETAEGRFGMDIQIEGPAARGSKSAEDRIGVRYTAAAEGIQIH
jgi:hypothetical protein